MSAEMEDIKEGSPVDVQLDAIREFAEDVLGPLFHTTGEFKTAPCDVGITFQTNAANRSSWSGRKVIIELDFYWDDKAGHACDENGQRLKK